EKLLQQEQWAYLSTHPPKRLTSFCYDDDDEDYTSVITPAEPVLSTEEPDNSLTLYANLTLSFDCKTKSSSTSLNSLLEETNTFDNSLPEFETFCFDVEEISSGSTTTHPDISLLEYEAFYDDHVKEISSGIAPHYLLSLRNEDAIFDPGICNSTFFRPDISHRYRTVKKFNTHRSHLNKCPMLIHGLYNPPLVVLLFHFYPL
nr:hypothetical protein [Tanacetum cinerariifolium]